MLTVFAKPKKMSFISSRFGQFTYFDLQLEKPIWRGRTVLDFGGNVGNILKDPGSTIDHDKYWCIDVSKAAIQRGKEVYPQAHWIFYDRYNFAFNPAGVKGLEVPNTGHEFDYILAYSVFSHVSKSEMMELVSQLEDRLGVNGVLAFTFIDPHFNPAMPDGKTYRGYYDGSNLRQRLERQNKNDPSVDVQPLLERARNSEWGTLVNDDDLYIENENVKHYSVNQKRSFCTFYSAEYMKTLFPDAIVLAPPHSAYTPSEEAVLQHCCVIRKAQRR
jgi:SAM-dependent methyltransferase